MVTSDTIPNSSITCVTLHKGIDEFLHLDELKHQLFLNPDLKASELLEILEQGKVLRR